MEVHNERTMEKATKKEKESVFSVLNAIDCSEHTEKKNGLPYLSWPWAIGIVKKNFPDVTYEVRHWDGKPYYYDETLGYMVETSVTIKGETNTMWLPVMDAANKAQKSKDYEYQAKNPNFKYAKRDNESGKYIDKYGNVQEEYVTKTVCAATMFDINTAIMRCLVKNLAMFGLGLYIYAGEDLPDMDFTSLVAGVKTEAELKGVWDMYCRKYGQPKATDNFCKEVVKKQEELREAAESTK